MLTELHIQNFAIIDDLTVHFEPGLNVLTGETGAGKSIVIDAIGAVLGLRVGVEDVRAGAEAATIEATFELGPGNPALRLLEEWGIPAEEGVVLISRDIAASGRSRCRINGRTATVTMLREVGEYLVDIHGQHEHQSLLKIPQHLTLLDASGPTALQKARKRVSSLYLQWQERQRQLAALQVDEREKARRIDLLIYQVEEIKAAQLRPGEEEELRKERTRLANVERLLEATTKAYALLYEVPEAGGRSALDLAAEAQTELEDIVRFDARLAPLRESLETALSALQEAAYELRAYRDGLEFNPYRLEEIEQRLALIESLKRKYGATIEEVLAYGEQAQRELDELTHREERGEELEQEIAELEGKLGPAAAELSQLRRKAAQKLEREVVRHLQDLRMERVSFQVSFEWVPNAEGVPVAGERYALTGEGLDRVEFLLSPNPGEPLRPLAKIASGGEISRIMLALKSVLMAADRLPTLIFDEIDVGIGGATARAVGQKLAALGQDKQVICVTHLPQIASLAHAHFRIQKGTRRGRAYVEVTPLDEEQRIWELGRMLGGEEVTPTTLQHARELLQARAKSS